MNQSKFQSGFVAIVGRPNVGKSTLLNRLTGEKVAIVSDKPQTTRNKILAISTTKEHQLIYVDTPGVHRPKNKLGEYMNQVVDQAIGDVDAALFVCDGGLAFGEQEEKILQQLKKREIPTVLVFNKIDLLKKEALLPQIADYSKRYDFAAIVPICAKDGDGVGLVEEELLKIIPEGPMFYPEDQLTDQPEKQIAAETIREKMLRLVDQEVPHGTAVEIMSFKEEKELIRISATIYCEKDSHKAIIIGKNGQRIKQIGSQARQDLERFYHKKIFLELWVKVKNDWRNKGNLLKEFGYDM